MLYGRRRAMLLESSEAVRFCRAHTRVDSGDVVLFMNTLYMNTNSGLSNLMVDLQMSHG